MSVRTALPLLALCFVLAAAGCKDDDPVAPGSRPELAPNFALKDVNSTSATFDQAVSPRDHLKKVSAWYFGHAT